MEEILFCGWNVTVADAIRRSPPRSVRQVLLAGSVVQITLDCSASVAFLFGWGCATGWRAESRAPRRDESHEPRVASHDLGSCFVRFRIARLRELEDEG
jgi:hypothetical protein